VARIRDVILFEVPRAIKKRSFWFASLLPVVIILVVLGISVISSNNAKKADQQTTQVITKTANIGVLDETGLIDEQQISKQHITLEPTVAAGITAVRTKQLDAFIYYPKDVTKTGIKLYAQDKGISLSQPYSVEATQLLRLDVIAQVSATTRNPQLVQILETGPNVTTTTFKNGVQINSLANLVAPGVFFAAFLVLMILTSYLMVTGSTEEKENRVAEIILTSIKSQTLILGKILSIFILGLVQIIVIIVPLLVAYLFFRSHIALPGGLSLSHIPINAGAVTFGALFLIGGLALFTGLLVGLGALFPSAQEAGRYLGLAMIWVYLPIYTITYIISSPHTLIVSIFTYFPLTAPTVALLRNMVGALSILDAVIALCIIYISATLAILFAIRAFRYGAMEYGRRIGLKELLR